MRLPICRLYLGAWLLVAALWCGACSSKQTDIKTPLPAQTRDDHVADEQRPQRAIVQPGRLSHGFDKTEVDLEHGQPEPASLYHHPREMSLYEYDKTETDFILGPKKTSPSQSR